MRNLHIPAIRVHAYGASDQLFLEEVPVPVPAKDEVLLKIVASGVNPIDWKIREGMMQHPLPFTPGVEASGVVTAVGDGVFGMKIGDEVYGAVDGSYAAYAVAPAVQLYHKPLHLSFEEAAAMGGGKTAWGALFDVAKLTKGQRILIHAGAGGVGLFAVQLAFNAGAYVIATASAENMDFVTSLGANEVIDYKAAPFETQMSPVDIVFDTVGGETTNRSIAVVKPGGLLLCIVNMPTPEKVEAAGIRALWGGTKTVTAMKEIDKLLHKELIKPYVRKVFKSLSHAAAAQDYSQNGGPGRGKIVLRISEE
ncbi:NADPH:quinone reductase-like Zn-dependent oxidoreductase [Chitinophaga niastensis]|uniref:NADPH:quinone reductase-like Zn-dependent oxidoreductase n=1 Tax=Chitinophaga niastensis TaxID=536980 RepID=A0A2P8HC52_CHINA|nr:NADP-dependent oxidoreductase [Chitinophaga niastensis]PSL43808.1 NADPH:quinone reductase-like Zn-dependent oxidoreductase [Chitinophaga niastensis]